ncbi:hypothetical protein C1634_015750 [Chryseobacterium viscerum]|uniref:Uncharacterized protein n=1 Tax=Chryseobacterium viscerum TaxID=1037377 RepID=A0A316WG74_9FLAO|nr:hypothetical protein C1634_015750 [Chryseobacterium viscerum]
MLIVLGEKVKVCQEQKIFTPNTKVQTSFFWSLQRTVRMKNIIYKILGKNKVCQAQKFLHQIKSEQTLFFKSDGSPKWKSRGGLQNRCVN